MSCISQGRGYFENARDADESVRPLLLYYGVLSLSRGLILFLNPESREATLKQSHGLEILDWSNSLAKSDAKLVELSMRVTSGTFSELADVAQRQFVPYVTGAGDLSHFSIERNSGVPTETVIKIDDVLSRIPQVAAVYSSVLEKQPSNYFGIILEDIDSVSVNLQEGLPDGIESADDVRKTFNVPAEFRIDRAPETIGLVGSAFAYRLPGTPSQNAGRLPVVESTEPWGVGRLIAPWPNGGHATPLLRAFLLSYALGMLVRYFPSKWMAQIHGHRGDGAMPLLRASIDYIGSEFPPIALSALEANFD